MAEVGPNIGATIVLGGGGDSRSDAVRDERRDAVRAEAKESFAQADRMVTEYINRTSIPRTREDAQQIRQFIRSFFTEQQLNSREVDHLFAQLKQKFPDIDPGILGVETSEPAPNQPNPVLDARTDAAPLAPDPREESRDAGTGADTKGDRFVKNPNPAHGQSLAARGVAKDAPPSSPPQPRSTPPPPQPGSSQPKPGSLMGKSGAPVGDASSGVISTGLPTGQPPATGMPVIPGSPVVVADGTMEPPAPVRFFSMGADFGPGKNCSPEDQAALLERGRGLVALAARGGNMAGTAVPMPVPTAATVGTTLLGRLARARTSSASSGGRKGSSERDDGSSLDGAVARGVYRQLGFRRA